MQMKCFHCDIGPTTFREAHALTVTEWKAGWHTGS